MGIEWLRDLVIFIAGIVLIGVSIFISVLLFLLYRRTKSLLNSTEYASKTFKGVSSYLGDEASKSMVQIAAFVQGICQGIDVFSKLFKRKGEGND